MGTGVRSGILSSVSFDEWFTHILSLYHRLECSNLAHFSATAFRHSPGRAESEEEDGERTADWNVIKNGVLSKCTSSTTNNCQRAWTTTKWIMNEIKRDKSSTKGKKKSAIIVLIFVSEWNVFGLDALCSSRNEIKIIMSTHTTADGKSLWLFLRFFPCFLFVETHFNSPWH